MSGEEARLVLGILGALIAIPTFGSAMEYTFTKGHKIACLIAGLLMLPAFFQLLILAIGDW